MKCITCEAEINPKFKHAIEQNACPFCGGSIMEELLKSLLISLQDTMQKLQAYPDQLSDWLLSNYSYIKTDSVDIIDYVPQEALRELKKELDDEDFDRKKKIIKVRTDRGEEEVVTEKIQSDSKTASFFERAELIKPGSGDMDSDESDGEQDGENDDRRNDVKLQPIKPQKPKSFKSAAERTQYIKGLKKKVEAEFASPIASKKSLADMIEHSSGEEANPDDVAEYGSMIKSGDIVSSALPGGGDDEDAMVNRALRVNTALASKTKKPLNNNEADLKTLRQMQHNVERNQRKLASGEGGFSRS